uniref:Uncharacterized protein n=1 Tax=Klebsiella phage PMBT12 TaxID=3137283 RepID=A0AAU8BTS4_9VIRU
MAVRWKHFAVVSFRSSGAQTDGYDRTTRGHA